jgi:hypothetical protein
MAPAASTENPLADVAFTPIDGEPGALGWSAMAGYHDVAILFDSLPARFPEGCSARLTLSFVEQRGDRALLSVGGKVFPERGARPPSACVGWRGVVRALDSLAEKLPQRAWAREATLEGERFELKGFIKGDAAALTSFADDLSSSAAFRDARVDSIGPAEVRGVAVVEFKMVLRLREET